MNSSIAFIVTPFLWASLPLPGMAFLIQRAQDLKWEVGYWDLNLAFYKMLGDMKKDWTVNPEYFQPGSYDNLYQRAPIIMEEFWTQITSRDFSFFALTLFKGNFHFARELSSELKKRFPQTKIIWGGPEIFSLYQKDPDFKNLPMVDHFVMGEGEKVLEEILKGRGKKLYLFEQETDLKGFPQYRGINLKNYPRGSTLPLVSSRGCVNHCTFCSEKHLFPGYRFRPWEDLFEEVEYHRTCNKIRHFIFYDSLFNGHLQNIKKWCHAVIDHKLNISWEAQICIRASMDLPTMELMKASGCVNLFIGLESGSSEVLGFMKKPFTPKGAVDFFKNLKAADLQFEVSLITAFPGETETHHQETLNFLRSNKNIIPKIAQVSCYQKYPGTESGPAHKFSVGKRRLREIRDLLVKEGIAFTPAYIDNLI